MEFSWISLSISACASCPQLWLATLQVSWCDGAREHTLNLSIPSFGGIPSVPVHGLW